MAATSDKPKILIQLDGDPQPSVFDAVVAVDSGVDQLFRHGGIEPRAVRDLVYGGLFTRGIDELHRTAVFVGGSNVARGEEILQAVQASFFGPFRLSVMFDANGANTTAAAAVLAVSKHLELHDARVAVLGATGPVGQRAVRLLARAGAQVAAGSRQLDRAAAVCESLAQRVTGARLKAFVWPSQGEVPSALAEAQVVIAAGAAGAELLSVDQRRALVPLRVAVDLNAVPPTGLAGIEPTDKAREQDGVTCYGALGVGGLKMKIHKAALRRLFERNNAVLDAEEIFELGRELGV
ncbi:MAG: bifunctional NADP-dependent methylenetetrahydromethanopterin dehydrogenase/methylenetetrahydrofolate dehydrogenase [Pirellulales bacterium]|nr:bifunctional NADP-dependent methylenetetrahydromethanopterin dehydrogenase/methylenetetrahydrofolate dehydrogenase [Pirellulales bacterium]